MDAGATAAPASGALARGALLLLFGLLRRAAAPHTDGLGDGLAVMVHVADLNRVARLEIGGADVLAALLDLGLRVDRERPLGLLVLPRDTPLGKAFLTFMTIRACFSLVTGSLLFFWAPATLTPVAADPFSTPAAAVEYEAFPSSRDDASGLELLWVERLAEEGGSGASLTDVAAEIGRASCRERV